MGVILTGWVIVISLKLRQLRDFVDGGVQTSLTFLAVISLVDLQDGVGTGSPVRAAALKGSRIDEKDAPGPMADRLVAVTINNTVGLGEHGPDPFFNGVPRAPGTMTQPDAVVTHRYQLAVWQELLVFSVAHIAMDRMDFLAAEGLEDGDIREVSGVEDDGTFRKDSVNLSAEGICTAIQVGV
jgi:hypothetical protein